MRYQAEGKRSLKKMVRRPMGTLTTSLVVLAAVLALVACGETASPTPVVSASPIPAVSASPIPVVSASPVPVVSASPVPAVSASPIPVVSARQGEWMLAVDPSTGVMTLNANEASLLGILSELKEKYRVDVIVPNLTEQTVTADIQNVPLANALATFLPSDSRFHFSAEVEVAIRPRLGDKEPRKDLEPKDPDLLTKDRTVPLPEELKTIVKVLPDEVRAIETTGEKGTKILPEEILEVPLVKEPKKPRELPPEEGRYGRLLFGIDSEGVRVIGFLELEGSLLESATVDGEFVHVVLVDDKPRAVGSMQDPLGVRSYREDIGHSLVNEKEGTFLISLPEQFLSATILERTTILFFYLEPVGPIPLQLTPDTFPRFQEHLREIGRIEGVEVLKAFAERVRPEDRG